MKTLKLLFFLAALLCWQPAFAQGVKYVGNFHGNGVGLTNLSFNAQTAVTNWYGILGGYVSQDGLAATEILPTGHGFFGRPPPAQTYVIGFQNGLGYRTNILRFCFLGTNAAPGTLVNMRVGQGNILNGLAVRVDVQGTVPGTNGSRAVTVPGVCVLSMTNYSHATQPQTNMFLSAWMEMQSTPATNFQWFIGIQQEWYR